MVPTGSKYTDEDRRNAAFQYAMYGSLARVEKETGIPDSTLCQWKQSEWWDEVFQQAQTLIEDRFRADCNKIVEKATETTLDRMENGDTVVTKEGLKRIPMKGRDAAVIGAMYYDKLRLSLNLPTSITERSGYKKAIEGLIDEFNRLADRDRRVVSVQESGKSEISTGS